MTKIVDTLDLDTQLIAAELSAFQSKIESQVILDRTRCCVNSYDVVFTGIFSIKLLKY